MSFLSNKFEAVTDVMMQAPIAVVISDIYGTLLDPVNPAVEKLLLWAEQQGAEVILASTDPEQANADICAAPIAGALRGKTVQDKTEALRKLRDDGTVFLAVDDHPALPEAYDAAAVLDPKDAGVRRFLSEQVYKAPAP